jgi:elongation factor P
MVLEIDGDLWAITYFQHVKPGKGGAFVRTKLKNVLTGLSSTRRTGRARRSPTCASSAAGELQLHGRRPVLLHGREHLRHDPDRGRLLGERSAAVSQGEHGVRGAGPRDKVISVELPQFVELEVTETDPGFKGDTAQGAPSRRSSRPAPWSRCRSSSSRATCSSIDRTEDKYLSRVSA